MINKPQQHQIILIFLSGKQGGGVQRRSQRVSVSFRDPLTVENYKDKFTQLVETEKEEHRGHLKQRYVYNFFKNVWMY